MQTTAIPQLSNSQRKRLRVEQHNLSYDHVRAEEKRFESLRESDPVEALNILHSLVMNDKADAKYRVPTVYALYSTVSAAAKDAKDHVAKQESFTEAVVVD